MGKYNGTDWTLKVENTEGSISRIIDLIYCLYGMKYKEKKTLNSRINSWMENHFSKNLDSEVRKAMLLTRKISKSFSLHDAPPLEWEDVKLLKNALEIFAKDILNIVWRTTNPYCLATRSLQFLKEWNNIVCSMDGQFLKGFGDIFSTELYISNEHGLLLFTTMLQKAKIVPRELQTFQDKQIQSAIIKSIEAHIMFQKKILQQK